MRGARNNPKKLEEITDTPKKSIKNPTEAALISETEKWLRRIQDIPEPKMATRTEKDAWKNVQAYIEDSQYFVDKRDWVRAFEACIWAWAFYEAIFKFGKK